MDLTLRERVPSRDPILPLLFQASSAPLFPGGHFLSGAALERRLAYLDAAGAGAPQGLSALPSQPQQPLQPAPRAWPRPSPVAVAALLRKENAFASLYPAQEANLDLAGRSDTVFVLTGQQPGLLGGPALWLYKAITAIALAAGASRRLGRPVIPVFWVAGDDSDLRECNQIELLEDLPREFPATLSLTFPEPGRQLAVGARPLDGASLNGLYDALGRIWRPATVAAARRSLEGGGTLAEAFLRLAQARLGPLGMLFLNGYSPAVRAAGRPVLERAVADWTGIQAALGRGTASLRAAGLEPPVGLREGVVHAFALRAGERSRLYAAASHGSGQPGRVYTADSPSLDLLPALPGLELTHDVFTRPLVADSLLPVLGHVLGPVELRYFAQMAPVFLEWTGDMPLVHPRQSVTVAAAGDESLFAAEGIGLADAAALKPSDLRSRLREKAWRSHPAAGAIPSGPPREMLDALRRSHTRHFRDTGPLDRLERALRRDWNRYLAALGNMAYAEAGPVPEASAPESRLFGRLRWLGNGGGQDKHLNLHSLLDAVGEEGLAGLIRTLAEDPDAAEPGNRIFTWPGGTSA